MVSKNKRSKLVLKSVTFLAPSAHLHDEDGAEAEVIWLSPHPRRRRPRRTSHNVSVKTITVVCSTFGFSESNTPQQAVESDLLDETNDVERRCQNELMEGRWKESLTYKKKDNVEDQHQEEYDQEKGRNSDNEEESQQIANDEEELHNTTRFDVATWPAPMFLPIAGKTAVELTENILTQLEGDNLDIHLCRAQGYDNAATMAGVHGGVQAIIKEHNPKTLFMPCANHLLNLWSALFRECVSVKRLVETRWSAHHDAVKSLKNNFEKLVSTLEDMCDLSSSRENADTREAASTLLPALCDFSFLCYLSFWCEVLEEVNQTQKYTQTPGYHWKKDIILEILRLRRYLEAASISLQEAVRWTTLELLKFIVKWNYSESVPSPALLGWTLDKTEVVREAPTLSLPAPGTVCNVHVFRVLHDNKVYLQFVTPPKLPYELLHTKHFRGRLFEYESDDRPGEKVHRRRCGRCDALANYQFKSFRRGGSASKGSKEEKLATSTSDHARCRVTKP
ncbi:hypothetical protein EVAR_72888_1 [Eumeta japonica]|uniref:DUF4371 domain-containing protein n=1 Tax=Eumeta variegata TaxID=151549 RepID=A0A4C1SLA0_EUMVA|nr:hypothetical protein EVAR_72888_1 [Eumeta japonica]